MKKSLVFMMVAVALIFTNSIIGQSTDEFTKGEFFAGYSSHTVVDDDFFVVSRGVNFSGVYNVKRYIGIKGDASFSVGKKESFDFVPFFDNPTMAHVAYTNQLIVNNAVAGVQFKDNATDSRFKPFAHVMFGIGQVKNKVTNISCTTPSNCSYVPQNGNKPGFSSVIGGGLDIRINKRIDIRAAQLDLNFISNGDNGFFSTYGQGSFRFSSGIIVKF